MKDWMDIALEAQNRLLTEDLTDEEARNIVLDCRKHDVYLPIFRARGYKTIYGKYSLWFAISHPEYFKPKREVEMI